MSETVARCHYCGRELNTSDVRHYEIASGWLYCIGHAALAAPSPAPADELLSELRQHQRDYPSLIHSELCGRAADEIERLRSAQPSPEPGAIADGEAGCQCHGCGALYRVDINVSDALWQRIARGDRLLCGRCICSRIEAMGEFGAFTLAAECPHTDIDFSRQCYACGEIVPGPGAGGEWQWVPKEPAGEQQAAGRDVIQSYLPGGRVAKPVSDQWQIAREVYAAMLAAAPQQGGDNAG